jgi:hypothetical protein
VTTEQWWADTTAAALLGTGRRPPPPLPVDLGVRERDGGAEERLLDAAALGGMLRRAGSVVRRYAAAAPAPPDDWPAAPDRAVHLLQLLLTQPPFGAHLALPALRRWLQVAAGHRRRVPHAELVALLTAATRTTELQPLVAAVADARGGWLAAANPAWAWLARPPGADADAVPTPEEWATLPTADRVALLGPLRRSDPAAARALVESTWSTEPARDRQLLLGSLQVGLGPDDEELLERALDDRAGAVRDVAQKLLDRLPESARAQRMAARLRPLVRVSGMLRRSLEVELPSAPDAAAVRDGLGRKPSNWSSERGYWLGQLAAGAPLDLWTEITGRDVADAWRMLHDASKDARAGVMRAAMVRHDARWLRAMLEQDGPTVLLKHLPPADAAELAPRHLARVPTYDLHQTLSALPAPWDRRLAEAVLDRVAADKDQAGALAGVLPVLADRLPPDVVPRVQRWARAEGAPRALADLVQYLSFVPAIPEAFG